MKYLLFFFVFIITNFISTNLIGQTYIVDGKTFIVDQKEETVTVKNKTYPLRKVEAKNQVKNIICFQAIGFDFSLAEIWLHGELKFIKLISYDIIKFMYADGQLVPQEKMVDVLKTISKTN